MSFFTNTIGKLTLAALLLGGSATPAVAGSQKLINIGGVSTVRDDGNNWFNYENAGDRDAQSYAWYMTNSRTFDGDGNFVQVYLEELPSITDVIDTVLWRFEGAYYAVKHCEESPGINSVKSRFLVDDGLTPWSTGWYQHPGTAFPVNERVKIDGLQSWADLEQVLLLGGPNNSVMARAATEDPSVINKKVNIYEMKMLIDAYNPLDVEEEPLTTSLTARIEGGANSPVLYVNTGDTQRELGIEVYDATGSRLSAMTTGLSGERRIGLEARSPGAYFVRVVDHKTGESENLKYVQVNN